MNKMERVATVWLMALLFACSAVVAGEAVHPYGTVIESAVMPSKILGHDLQYTVYLPPGYHTSNRSYPVMYLLHGAGDSDNGWVQLGDLQRVMDTGIAEGRITPMIVVTPDGRRKFETQPSTYYLNDADGNYSWSDMFHQEFIPFFEKECRVRSERNPRGIGGLSMGGFGALHHAFTHPGMFSVVIGLSAAVHTQDDILGWNQFNYDRRYGMALGTKGMTGQDRMNDEFRKKHPLSIMHTLSADELRAMHIYLDCGAEDYLDAGNNELHQFLKKSDVDHRFLIRRGKHVWPFWREAIGPAMEYASAIFTD